MRFQCLLYVFAGFVATALAAGIPVVASGPDIHTQTIRDAITTLPNVGRFIELDILPILTDVVSLSTAADTAASDTKDTRSLSKRDGLILAGTTNLKTRILDRLNELMIKKDVSKDSGSPNEVSEALKMVRSIVVGVLDTVIAAVPAKIKSQVTTIKKDIVAGLDEVITVFAST